MYTYQTDRPISTYIRQACRAYVRERIRAGDYRYTGTDPEVARLFPDGEALCDDDAYACFVSHLENNPLRTQIACDPEPSTDAVFPADPYDTSLYLVGYGTGVFPIGFLFSFFEDEFATHASRTALTRAFYADAKQDTMDAWNRTRFCGRRILLEAKEGLSALIRKGTRQSYRMLAASLCVLIMLGEMALFAVRYRVFPVMWQFFRAGFSRTALLHASVRCPALLSEEELVLSECTITAYMNAVGIPLALNLLFFLLLVILLLTLYRAEMRRTFLLTELGEHFRMHSALSASLEKDGTARLSALCDRLIATHLRPTHERIPFPAACAEPFRRYAQYNREGYDKYRRAGDRLSRRHSFLPLLLLLVCVTLTDIPFFFELLLSLIRLARNALPH